MPGDATRKKRNVAKTIIDPSGRLRRPGHRAWPGALANFAGDRVARGQRRCIPGQDQQVQHADNDFR